MCKKMFELIENNHGINKQANSKTTEMPLTGSVRTSVTGMLRVDVIRTVQKHLAGNVGKTRDPEIVSASMVGKREKENYRVRFVGCRGKDSAPRFV